MGYREDNDNRKKSLCPGMNIGNNLEGYLCKRIDKKICYWPRGVHVYRINEYYSSKNIDAVVCLSGEWGDMEFYILL